MQLWCNCNGRDGSAELPVRRIALAKSLLAEQEALIPKVKNPRNDLPGWLYSAKGMIALIENDAKAANRISKRHRMRPCWCRTSTRRRDSICGSGWLSRTSGLVMERPQNAWRAN